MDNIEETIQVRDADGQLFYFQTFADAWKYQKFAPEAWKISVRLPTGERIRMVRNSAGEFIVEQILDAF